MKAVGYIRVSTSEQANEGISLDNQRHKIKTYAELKDFNLIEIIADEGRSGKNLKREGVQKLIRLVTSKKVDAVIVYKLDRLTRSTKDLLYLIEDVFIKSGITFCSLSESIDTTTAQGKFFLTITGAMNQMTRDQISENTQDALKELIRQKRRLGSPDMTPYGFKQTKRKKAEISDLKLIPKEIEDVKLMFSMRKDNRTLEVIGKRFGLAKSSVKYILENKIYQETGIISSVYEH